MPKGGKRVGAGRKPGALTVKTRDIATAQAMEGPTPLDVLLLNMRHNLKLAQDAEAVIAALSEDEAVVDANPKDQFNRLLAEVKKTVGLREQASRDAERAAPFMHARLSPVEKKGADPSDHEEPLVDRLKRYARADAIEASGGKVIDLTPKRVTDRGPFVKAT